MQQLDKNIKRKYSLSNYNTDWIKQFDLIEKLLKEIFKEKATRIEHIGSTSIIGMIAKPVIDVLVVVNSVEDLFNQKEQMVHSGYKYAENYIAPSTIMFYKELGDGSKTENIHICEEDSFKVKQFLIMRDFLKSFPEKAKEYSDLKKQNQLLYPDDYPAYRKAKDPFLKKIEQEAYEWFAGLH